MKVQVGMELCLAGSSEKITHNGKCTIVAGMIMIVSPIFPMLEIRHSDDYRSVSIHENIENIMTLFMSNLSGVHGLPLITPYMQLSEEQRQHFLLRVHQIRTKEQQLSEMYHPIQRNLATNLVSLAKQEALLECALLFSEQLLHEVQKPSNKKQVLVTFLVSLNKQYRQCRTVKYYAEQQNMTPRNLSIIVKQESGYTPMEWIHMVTICNAKNFLSHSDMSIKQVAIELGFPEQFTFRKYFKTHTGISPSKYREMRFKNID